MQGGTPAAVIRFWVDLYTIRRGKCTKVHWHMQKVKEIYYRGRPLAGENWVRSKCPKKTKIYDFITIKTDGNPVLSTLTTNVTR